MLPPLFSPASSALRSTLLAWLPMLVMLAAPSASFGAASVSNVRASQRADGTGFVDVYYDLSGASGTVHVELAISTDAGVSYGVAPQPARLSGDVGPGVANGTNRHIVWDVVRDRPEIHWPDCRARVTVAQAGDGITFSLVGGVLLEMVKIPAGTFVMGSLLDEGWSSDAEYPAHNVTIANDYYMGKFEVTQAQWVSIMGSNPSNCSYGCGAEYPVQTVSWNDIQTFLASLNAQGFGGTFRLPTEAEWERAARGGTSTRFPFGQSDCSLSDCTTVCELGDYAYYCANDNGDASPVGSRLPNPFGLYDTMGNVWEWVEDDWHSNYIGAPSNGSAWIEEPRTTARALRGGHWGNNPRYCRPAYRNSNTASDRFTTYGFRLAWTP